MTRAALLVAGLATAASLGLVALIVASALEMSLADGLADVAGTLWGVTTLADLGVGLVLVAGWMLALERRWLHALPWILALAMLGNLATAIYVAVRCVRRGRLDAALLPRAATAEREESHRIDR